MWQLRLLAVVLFAVLSGLQPAHAEKRVALVIGNGAYVKVGKLPNPVKDANAIAALLRTARFEVVEVKSDLDGPSMRRALRDFTDHTHEADIAVVFYAGHGIEVNGTNYLIPVDAALERDIDVEDEAVSLERVTQLVDRARRLRLIILDACRDNPFVRSIKRTTRSIGRGLARVDVLSTDSLVAFAAKHGTAALDGDGANSPYTTALLKHLATPGLDLRLALGRVRDDVLKSTASKQEPFVYGSLGGAEIALIPLAKGVAKAPSPPLPEASPLSEEAARAWGAVKDTSSIPALEAFVRRYGQTFHGDLAKMRIAELKQAAAAKVGAAATEAKPAPKSTGQESETTLKRLESAKAKTFQRLDECKRYAIAKLKVAPNQIGGLLVREEGDDMWSLPVFPTAERKPGASIDNIMVQMDRGRVVLCWLASEDEAKFGD